jgi:hypothetical protein
MPDFDGERPERAQSWLDLEWVDPTPKADDDLSVVQAFIEKLSLAVNALRRGKQVRPLG